MGNFRNNYLIHDVAFHLADLATRAVLHEVSTFPKPGLVTPVSTGAHDDMDHFTFINSASSLHKYFILFAQAGLTTISPADIFKEIRKIGIKAEKTMFLATKNVNTHKGMIFLMGVCLAATAKTKYDGLDYEEISTVIKEMTSGLVLDDLQHLTKETAVSHGEKLYIKEGVTGVRGEVELGIPTVFKGSLPFYNEHEHLAINQRLILTLFKIMTICDDTTIIHRHNMEKLKEVKKIAEDFLKIDFADKVEWEQRLKEIEHLFIKTRVSPGGSADLLAVTVFLSLVKEKIFK